MSRSLYARVNQSLTEVVTEEPRKSFTKIVTQATGKTDSDDNAPYTVSVNNFGVLKINLVTGVSRMSITSIDIPDTLQNSKLTDLAGVFEDFTKLESIDNLNSLDSKNVTSMASLFANCQSLERIGDRLQNTFSLSTKSATNMSAMFSNCQRLNNMSFGPVDTEKVSMMNDMFKNCHSLRQVNVSELDTNNVKDMSSMFHNCYTLNKLDVSTFDTSNLIDAKSMFQNCRKLRSLNLANWTTSKLATADNMFNGCSMLSILDLSGWDTGSIKSAVGMFDGLRNIVRFNVDKDFFKMFSNIKAERLLPTFNFPKWTDVNSIREFISSLPAETKLFKRRRLYVSEATYKVIASNKDLVKSIPAGWIIKKLIRKI